ncbi:regulatory LuxR family protein [Rhodococcus sp. SMB37]|uniref:response regulator transcription factor n=1 Tax=Rhodococcus sp. SMB37 TaxID=2512213 RepID=UPI0006D02776|nr:LuxR C-terminal-related transcriptional regulator [Rhodococcus sp. SMB37]TCN54835.1 regulatory LuxR family protein [Rhodococcus sp. SMB37]
MTIDQAVSFALGESTTAPNRAAQNTSPLTKREFEIARLVADGMSNRAIADKLVISPRTVDGHVERILAKLGVTSRTRIATWVTAHDG